MIWYELVQLLCNEDFDHEMLCSYLTDQNFDFFYKQACFSNYSQLSLIQQTWVEISKPI